jgi:hypothetical protein
MQIYVVIEDMLQGQRNVLVTQSYHDAIDYVEKKNNDDVFIDVWEHGEYVERITLEDIKNTPSPNIVIVP